MSFSAGTFSINTTGQPVVAGTTISASVFNAFTADIATGLSTCMLKDGTQTATAGIAFYAGTVSLPGIYFGTDTATGFYRIALNNTGFAINGTKLWDWSSTAATLTGTLTATTIGAFTLGGTIAGGGNQINNVIIGTSNPLAGSFTTLTETTGAAWTSYTPTLTTDTGTFGALTVTSARYRLLGKTLIIEFDCRATVATGSPTEFRLSLPTGTLKSDTYGPALILNNTTAEMGAIQTGATSNYLAFVRTPVAVMTGTVYVRTFAVVELA